MVVLYTNHCPLCNSLKEMLQSKGVEFEEETSIDKMIAMGLENSPMPRLAVDENLLNYKEALKWLNEKK